MNRSPAAAGRPYRVKVGHLDFTIDYLTDDAWPDREPRKVADCDKLRGRIRVLTANPDGPFDEGTVRDSVLHELLHAIHYAAGVPTGRGEERTISALTGPLVALLRDNPDLTAYLTHQEIR